MNPGSDFFTPESITSWIAAAAPMLTPVSTALNAHPAVAIRAVEGADSGLQSVSADALVVGSEARVAVAADRRVVQALATGGEAVRQALLQSPLTGCTSVLDATLARSGWNPLDPAQSGNFPAFARYLALLTQSGFFPAPPSRSEKQTSLENGGHPPSVAKAVAAMLPDLSERDRSRVTGSILDLAHRVLDGTNMKNVHADGYATLFVQQVLAVGTASIEAHLHWCQAVMRFDRKSNKATVTEAYYSVFKVQRFTFSLPLNLWPAKAPVVAREKITDVETWIRNNSCLAQS